MPQKSLFLQTVRYKARARRLSRRTERAYVAWIRRFIRHNELRHPADLGEAEAAAFLNYLAAERGVAPSTQTQALCALLFLYDHVLGRPLGRMEQLSWARPRGRLPVVLTREEVEQVLRVSGETELEASLWKLLAARVKIGGEREVRTAKLPRSLGGLVAEAMAMSGKRVIFLDNFENVLGKDHEAETKSRITELLKLLSDRSGEPIRT